VSKTSGKLVIYGAWYFGRVVHEAAIAAGWNVLGFVDPDPPGGLKTLGTVPADASVFVAIGDNAVRCAVHCALAKRGRDLATIIHPDSSISPSATVGAGSYIAEHACVRTGASIGEGVVLQAGSVVSHDCKIDAHVSLGPNAACASKVSIGACTGVGVGAAIAPGLIIGADCTVAAGAAVFKSVDNCVSLIGNPARATPRPEKPAVQSDWEANGVW